MYQDYKYRRAFASEIIEAAFFGAFMVAIDARKNEEHLTQIELAKRTGKEKTGMSKLLAGPRNWKLSTISDLAEALDLRLEFVLIDRHNPIRRFTQTGVAFVAPPQNYLEISNDFVTRTVDTIDGGMIGNSPATDSLALLNSFQDFKASQLAYEDAIGANQQLKKPIAV
jgi:transcriptional regulator with XRE-family HTH domain